jgi:hypothetical protein
LAERLVARFEIVAVMDGDECPAESFLLHGEESTEAVRYGLMHMLGTIAENGLQNVPHAWVHEANKNLKIYEFIKGPLRLFFFKGKNGQIAVYDRQATRLTRLRLRKPPSGDDYYEALKNDTLTTVNEDGT